METRRLLVMPFVALVACGMQRSSNSAPDVHGGAIACHGVLAPTQHGGKRALFFCGSGKSGCEASRAEQAGRGYEVSDCAPHPFAACFPNGSGQMCLSTMRECRDFAESAGRDPALCAPYDSDAPATTFAGTFAGVYESDRGWAVALKRGDALAITYARGTMRCALKGSELACDWDEKTTHGRARFAQQADGAWVGTWGAGESESGGGAWTFRRAR